MLFETRLKVVLAIAILCGSVIVVRLFQLQILAGDEYAERSQDALVAPLDYLPALRGRILDRFGRVLVSDEPAYDVTVHYAVLRELEEEVSDPPQSETGESILDRRKSKNKPKGPKQLESIDPDVGRMWATLSEASGTSMHDLEEREREITNWVTMLEDLIDVRPREKVAFHPVLRNVSPEVRTKIELALSNLSFVRVSPSVRRVWRDEAQPLCHVLGRMGEVSADTIEADPLKEDWLARYRPGDQNGVSGVERLGEQMLRGKRGYEERRLDGTLHHKVAPVDGLDVQLTIDLDLQGRVAGILEQAVAEIPSSAGASCVVIDVDEREILALVSVPTYDLLASRFDYAALRDDARRRPLLFRAVAEEYQPGSIIKPVTLAAGLATGKVDPGRTAFCDGSLIPGSDKWHCWTHWRGMAGHGYIAAEDAIQHSCNVYFYGVGQRLGAAALTGFLQQFLCGPPEDGETHGTGLIEERDGLIPTADWIRKHRHREFRPADGRNYAIGQGELQITPLLAANMFATVATGVYRDPTLIANDGRERPRSAIVGLTDAHWSLIRRGLHRCVNEIGGTAYKYARMEEIELCGKTGSAQCVARVVERQYTFETGDPEGPTKSILAPNIEAARKRLGLDPKSKCVDQKVVRRWPPNEPGKKEPPTHAWFAGYAPYDKPKIAFAVIVEYGGGGGSAAAPAAKAIVRELLIGPNPYLDSKQAGPSLALSGGAQSGSAP